MASSTGLEVSIEPSQGLERRMTVRIPQPDIEREIDARLKKVGKTARLKGFRPGKVPAKVVRQRYAGQVRQEVLADVIRSSFSQAIAQKQLNPAGGPAIEPISGGENESHFSYRAVFEVYPEFELKDVKKLKFELPAVSIEAADVEQMIERLRLQRAEWQTVERAAADGDRVIVDFEGTIGGEPFEGGKGEEVAIVLGEGQVIADFEKALRGLSAGDEKTAKVKFPKDYGVADLAGKKAEFAIKAQSVEEQVLPEVDAEFMQAFGIGDGDADAFEADVRKNMQRELDERRRADSKTRVLDALHDANRIDVPKSLIDEEIRTLTTEAMRRMGISDPAQAPGPENFQSMAEKRVRLGLLVQELIVAHKLELDRRRVDERIAELSAPYEKPDEAAQLYRSNRELLGQVESAVLEEQVVDYLIEQGQASEKTVGFDEFMNMQD